MRREASASFSPKTSAICLARGIARHRVACGSPSRSIEMQEVVQVPCLATGHDSGEQTIPTFVDRRQAGGIRKEGSERRQFTDSRRAFRPEVIELAEAV